MECSWDMRAALPCRLRRQPTSEELDDFRSSCESRAMVSIFLREERDPPFWNEVMKHLFWTERHHPWRRTLMVIVALWDLPTCAGADNRFWRVGIFLRALECFSPGLFKRRLQSTSTLRRHGEIETRYAPCPGISTGTIRQVTDANVRVDICWLSLRWVIPSALRPNIHQSRSDLLYDPAVGPFERRSRSKDTEKPIFQSVYIHPEINVILQRFTHDSTDDDTSSCRWDVRVSCSGDLLDKIEGVSSLDACPFRREVIHMASDGRHQKRHITRLGERMKRFKILSCHRKFWIIWNSTRLKPNLLLTPICFFLSCAARWFPQILQMRSDLTNIHEPELHDRSHATFIDNE